MDANSIINVGVSESLKFNSNIAGYQTNGLPKLPIAGETFTFLHARTTNKQLDKQCMKNYAKTIEKRRLQKTLAF